jgi:hypothetical protein
VGWSVSSFFTRERSQVRHPPRRLTAKAEKLRVEIVDQAEIWRLLIAARVA